MLFYMFCEYFQINPIPTTVQVLWLTLIETRQILDNHHLNTDVTI
jgi:hypothetical protein